MHHCIAFLPVCLFSFLAIKRNCSCHLIYLNKIIRLVDLIPERNSDINGPYPFRQKNLKSLCLGFKGLQGGIPDILSFYLRAVEHLVRPTICCLGMIVSLGIVDFLPVCSVCGHFQDHSIVRGSAVRNAVAGILVDLGIHHNQRLQVL